MVELKHKELTGKIIGCAMEVHTYLGNGFQEVIYQRALAKEMHNANLTFARELEMQIYYKDDKEDIGTRRVDFLVEDKVLVEIKAVGELNNIHYAQVLNYLKAYKLEVALLINFGQEKMIFKRFVR